MNNDLNVPLNRSPASSTPPIVSSEDATLPSSSVSSPDGLSAYDGIDALNPGPDPTVQSHYRQKNPLDFVAGNPVLENPDILESDTGPMPYGSTEKKMIRKFLSDKVKESLKEQEIPINQAEDIYGYLVNGSALSNPQLKALARKIGDKTEEETKVEARLPNNWKPFSKSDEDWIPTLIQPYTAAKQKEINTNYDDNAQTVLLNYSAQLKSPLKTDEIALIQEALSTGRVDSRVADHVVAITSQATKATQKTYGLPSTWFKATAAIEDWKPINIGIVTQNALVYARAEHLIENLEAIIKDYQTMGTKVLKETSSDVVSTDDYNEYLDIVAESIQYSKEQLRLMQIQEAESSLEMSDMQTVQIKQREILSIEEMDKYQTRQVRMDTFKWIGRALKIIGPLLTVTAIVVAIMSGGLLAALPMLIAGILIVLYTVVDSQLGITQKAVEMVDSVIADVFPNSELAQAIIKMVLVIAVVAVLVALIATGVGAGSATRLATQTVAGISKEIVKDVMLASIKPVAMQAIMIAVMSSNALPELAGQLVESAGLDDSAVMWVETLVIVLELVVMAISSIMMVKSMGATGTTTSTAKTAEEAAKTAADKIQETLNQIADQIKNAPNKAKETLLEIGKSIKELFDPSKYSKEGLVTGWKAMRMQGVETRQLANMQAVTILNMSNYTISALGNAINGALLLSMANLTKQLGELKAEDEYLLNLTKSYNDLINDLNAGISENASAAAQLQQVNNSFIDAFGQAMQDVIRPVRG